MTISPNYENFVNMTLKHQTPSFSSITQIFTDTMQTPSSMK